MPQETMKQRMKRILDDANAANARRAERDIASNRETAKNKLKNTSTAPPKKVVKKTVTGKSLSPKPKKKLRQTIKDRLKMLEEAGAS